MNKTQTEKIYTYKAANTYFRNNVTVIGAKTPTNIRNMYSI